jgi:two-component system, LytTR family, response regulator
MRINCIAIEDEPPALIKLKDFISRMPCLELLSTFDNAIEALAWLKEKKPGLIFLDIQMDQLTGIQLLETVKVDSAIIITSAYDRYALKGYELNVTDYLLKPYSFERFVKAVDKVLEHYSQASEIKNGGIESSIFVKTEYRYERIALDNILYIEGMSDYLRIVCTDKKIMTLQSFAKIEASLPPEKFCRIHKSFLVALDKIRSIERGIIVIADKRIPVSSTYREKLFSRIKLR